MMSACLPRVSSDDRGVDVAPLDGRPEAARTPPVREIRQVKSRSMYGIHILIKFNHLYQGTCCVRVHTHGRMCWWCVHTQWCARWRHGQQILFDRQMTKHI